MAQAPVAAGSDSAPPPRSLNNAYLYPCRPRPPSSNASARSVAYRGRMGDWTWRCEYCSRVRFLGRRAVTQENTPIWDRSARRNPQAWCDNCGKTASWNHILSETQVNRALRSPHQFLESDVAKHFRRLKIYDNHQFLRVLGPTNIASLQAAAREWIAYPSTFRHRNRRGSGTNRPPKLLLREI